MIVGPHGAEDGIECVDLIQCVRCEAQVLVSALVSHMLEYHAR